jgi:hypothetical protein
MLIIACFSTHFLETRYTDDVISLRYYFQVNSTIAFNVISQDAIDLLVNKMKV